MNTETEPGMKAGVVGCCGRLGRLVVAELLRPSAGPLTLAACATSPGSAWIGRDAGDLVGSPATGVRITADAHALCEASEVVIDFSAPSATALYAGHAARAGVTFITGTTGLDAAQQQAVAQAALHIAVVQAPHMSVGANLLMAITAQLAAVLDERYDVEILGKTHRNKADTPSGTTLALARAAAKARGVDADSAIVHDGPRSDGPRKRGTIGVTTMRAGEAFSEHVVLFAGRSERLELSHTVLSYDICAQGALRAGVWARGRPAGLYSMSDVLETRNNQP